jgi:hypothetical protein
LYLRRGSTEDRDAVEVGKARAREADRQYMPIAADI